MKSYRQHGVTVALIATAIALFIAIRNLRFGMALRPVEIARTVAASETLPVSREVPDKPIASMLPASSAASTAAAPSTVSDKGAALRSIAAFDAWLAASQPATTPLSNAQRTDGLALARERRRALKALISIDPRLALAHGVPSSVRQALPPEIGAQLEEPIDAFGNYEVVSVCGDHSSHIDRWTTIGTMQYATYTYGQRLSTLTKNHLAVHGFAIDNVLAMSEQPYRTATPDATSLNVAPTSAVQVQVGDTMVSFPTVAQRDEWAQSIAVAEQTPNPNALVPEPVAAALPAGWTVGQKTVLWIRAEFPDDPGSPATDDQINVSMSGVTSFYQDISHATCSFVGTIVPGTVKLTTLKSTYSADSTSYTTLRADAMQLARNYDAANGGSGMYNPDNYDRYIVVFKTVSGYSWAGISTVGGKGCCLNGNVGMALTAHELGHNHGLRHSHGWAPSTASPIGSGTHIEYGDAFDDMGSGQSGTSAGHFNTIQKYTLGYLTDSAISTVSQSGVYRIYQHDDRNASGIQALKIASSWPGTNYWLEYRHAVPYTGFATPAAGPPELSRLQNGIEVHWDHGPSFTTGPGTYLLDMTPTTSSGVAAPTDYNSSITHFLDDSALALGESFNDPAIAMTVTPINVGGTTPNQWIDVYVSLGSTATNHPPTVAAAMTSSEATARTNVTFTATGSDLDGDTVYYHWDFGDGSIAPTTATVTHQWLKGGTYSVLCTALDGRGGQSTTTIPVTVGDPLLTWSKRAASLTTHYFYDVLFDGTKFVAVGSYVAATSTDGINWTLGTGMGSANYNFAVAYGNSVYIAVGTASSGTTTTASVARSADGKSWGDVSPTSGVAALNSITYGSGRFVAVGATGSIVTTTDGLHWTIDSSGTTNDLNVVRYAAGKFVAAGAAGTYLTSTDGVIWKNTSIAGESSSSYGLVYTSNGWLSITSSYPLADTTKHSAWASPDATTWTKEYINVNSSMHGPIQVANSSLLLGVSRANDGRIFISQDGTTWTDAQVVAVPSGTNVFLQSAAEGNGTIVVVGVGGQIYTPSGLPFVLAQPASETVTAGQSVTWNAQAYGTGPFTYQWNKNGAAISGATNATFALYDTGMTDAGKYTVTITNAAGSYITSAATLTVNDVQRPTGPAAWISNLSVRANMSSGQTMIVGFTVQDGSEDILVRAAGPWLTTTFPQWFSPTSVMSDPRLAYYPNGSASATVTNDNWDSGLMTTFATVGASPFTLGSNDAALVQTITGANNTVWVQGTGPGYVLVEGYGLTKTGAPRLTNISARNHVGTGADILIAGFVLKGTGTKKLLIRGIGPRLNELWGIPGVLANPLLEVHDSADQVLASNAGWDSTTLAPIFDKVGAYQFTPGSNDAAMVVTLPASAQGTAYTAQVKGADGGSGEAVVEVYEVP